jgi:hypothetical protein
MGYIKDWLPADSFVLCLGYIKAWLPADSFVLCLGYIKAWLPADSFILRTKAMVLTGERTLPDTTVAGQKCPQAVQTAADYYMYGMSCALKSRSHRAHQSSVSEA